MHKHSIYVDGVAVVETESLLQSLLLYAIAQYLLNIKIRATNKNLM